MNRAEIIIRDAVTFKEITSVEELIANKESEYSIEIINGEVEVTVGRANFVLFNGEAELLSNRVKYKIQVGVIVTSVNEWISLATRVKHVTISGCTIQNKDTISKQGIMFRR